MIPVNVWISVYQAMPGNGQYIVKYWADTGNVWAGKHIVNPKFESFDYWMPLPDYPAGKPQKETVL